MSLLPPEAVLVPLVIQAQNGPNHIKATQALLKMVYPYLVHAATNVKYKFNGNCPVVSTDDLVSKARIILVERIIPGWSANKLFTHYLAKSVRLEMFHMVNEEAKKSKLVRPLESVNFEGNDEPLNYEEWALRHSKKEGQLPSYLFDGGFHRVELEYTLKNHIEPVNPLGARAIGYELQNGKTSVRRLAKYFDVSKSTVAKRKKDAITMLEKFIG